MIKLMDDMLVIPQSVNTSTLTPISVKLPESPELRHLLIYAINTNKIVDVATFNKFLSELSRHLNKLLEG